MALVAPSSVSLEEIRSVGCGLSRPECVVAHSSGLLFAADWTGPGGVAIIDPADGSVRRHLARDREANLKPNGIALLEDGAFLLARLGDAEGGVFRLEPDGRHTPVLTEVGGQPLPPTNFAMIDPEGRLYVTVSTWKVPRHQAARPGEGDGFVVMVPPGGEPRIVADRLGYTNECMLSADGATLYVNETFGRRTLAFPVRGDGSLGKREVFASFGEGIFPDGLALDVEGGVWVVSILSNSVIRVAADGTQHLVLQDADGEQLAIVEAAYRAGALTRALFDAPHRGTLKNVSSLAFGGAGMRTVYLGCLLGDTIASFEAKVEGHRPAHYDVPLTPLVEHGVLRGGKETA